MRGKFCLGQGFGGKDKSSMRSKNPKHSHSSVYMALLGGGVGVEWGTSRIKTMKPQLEHIYHKEDPRNNGSVKTALLDPQTNLSEWICKATVILPPRVKKKKKKFLLISIERPTSLKA